MPDRHVNALIYRIWHGRLTDHENPRPETFEESDVDVRVKAARRRSPSRRNSKEKNRPQKPGGHIKRWAFSADLAHGPDSFRLQFERAIVAEKSPPAGGGIQAGGSLESAIGFTAPAPKRLTTYPTTPSEIKGTPEADLACNRYMRYRQRAGVLPETAYSCLTVLEASVRLQARENPTKVSSADVCQWFGISSRTLYGVWRLYSTKGGPEARKADGIGKESHREESIFLEKPTVAVIRRMARRRRAGRGCRRAIAERRCRGSSGFAS